MRLFGTIEDKHGVNDPDYEYTEPKSRVSRKLLIGLLLLLTFPIGPIAYILWRLESRKRRWVLVAAVVGLLVLGWQAGTFDHALVNVGLNAKPCARNGFGATFCGKELEERESEQKQAKQAGEAAEHKAQAESEASEREAQKQEAKLKRESQEAEVRAQETQQAQENQTKELQANQEAEQESQRVESREQECLAKTGVRGC